MGWYVNMLTALYDQHGRMVLTAKEKTAAGSYSTSVDLTGYAKGIYYLKLRVGKESIIKKLVVE